MNAKKAKKCRRLARTAGMPEARVYMQNQRTGQIRLGKCERRLYKFLKKNWNKPVSALAAAGLGVTLKKGGNGAAAHPGS